MELAPGCRTSQSPLLDVDVKRAKGARENEPCLRLGVRAEQQALARWGLNYVIDEYLPAKLKATKSFRP